MRCMELPKKLEELHQKCVPYLIEDPNGAGYILKPGTPKHIVEAREKFLKLKHELMLDEIRRGIR